MALYCLIRNCSMNCNYYITIHLKECKKPSSIHSDAVYAFETVCGLTTLYFVSIAK